MFECYKLTCSLSYINTKTSDNENLCCYLKLKTRFWFMAAAPALGILQQRFIYKRRWKDVFVQLSAHYIPSSCLGVPGVKMLIGVLINYSNWTLSREVFSLVQMTMSICVSSSNCSWPLLACGQCYTRKTLWATSSFSLLVIFSFNFSFSVAHSNSVVSCKQHAPRELNRKEEHTETDRDFLTAIPHVICMIVPGRDQITSTLIKNLKWRSEPLHPRTGWH